MPFKKGVFRFAHETDLPILPVTIKDSFQVLTSDSLDLTPGSIEIIVHPPIHSLNHHMDHLDKVVKNTHWTISSAL